MGTKQSGSFHRKNMFVVNDQNK